MFYAACNLPMTPECKQRGQQHQLRGLLLAEPIYDQDCVGCVLNTVNINCCQVWTWEWIHSILGIVTVELPEDALHYTLHGLSSTTCGSIPSLMQLCFALHVGFQSHSHMM